MKRSFLVYATALVTVSALAVLVMADVELIVDKDNSAPFFIGSEKLATISTTLATAARDNAAISSLLDAALSQKYENATIRAWRRLVSGNATLVASAGPALSGNIKCFVGDNGEVVGLQYGSAVVCQKTSRIVHVKIGTNYISNIKVILDKNARIAGLQFILTNGVSGTSTVTSCGTKNGLSAYVGRAGTAVGALGGTCSTSNTGRRRLRRRRLMVSSNNSTSTPGIDGSKFAGVVVPAPKGENVSPPFSLNTTFTIDGEKFMPGV